MPACGFCPASWARRHRARRKASPTDCSNTRNTRGPRCPRVPRSRTSSPPATAPRSRPGAARRPKSSPESAARTSGRRGLSPRNQSHDAGVTRRILSSRTPPNPLNPTARAPRARRRRRRSPMNLLKQLEQEQITKLTASKEIPDFGPGDTVIVNVKVVEGERSRLQAYEGVCIARSGGGINQSFTVRKISYGEGVERVFPLYSPMVDSIKVVRRGKVRRAKLYYLRGLRGKKARITEKQDHVEAAE